MSKQKTTLPDTTVSNKAEWTEKILDPHLKTETERRAAFTTSSGLPLERLYASEDWLPDSASPAEKLGYPGAFPFTRGITPTMYRSQFWVMGMYSGYGSAEEANERYRTLLDRGQTGFSIALDLPTQCGSDVDQPLSAAEVRVQCVHIESPA